MPVTSWQSHYLRHAALIHQNSPHSVTSMVERINDVVLLSRAMREGAIWICSDHPGVFLAHGMGCQCGRVQE